MFTGLWPTQHGARVDRPYSGTPPTLAEHLRDRGYATAGFVANVRMCNRAYGLARGFDTYVDYPWNDEVSLKAAMSNSALGSSVLEVARRLCLPAPHHYPFNYRVSSSAIARQAKAWLEQVRGRGRSARGPDGRPFFLFLNFFDAHGPYLPEATGEAEVLDRPDPAGAAGQPEVRLECAERVRFCRPGRTSRRGGKSSKRFAAGWAISMTSASTRWMRSWAVCSSELRAGGMLANTWVVIVSDHGEHFGEHRQFGHGSSLYNEATHVPLILIPPLGPEGRAMIRLRRCAADGSLCRSRLRNLARTLAELTGPATENPFPGQSLAGHWTAANDDAGRAGLLAARRATPWAAMTFEPRTSPGSSRSSMRIAFSSIPTTNSSSFITSLATRGRSRIW